MNKYFVSLDKKVKKILAKNENLARLFYRQLNVLLNNPYNNILDIKKLKWQKNIYRLRIWKYRFLYEIFEDRILIFFFDVGSRWDIYK